MTTAAAAAPIRAALHAQLLDIERQHRAALDTERNILRAAQERLKAVNARIEAVRPRVLLDDRAADPYQALILERGALHQTVALAEQTVRQTSRGAEPPLAKATFKDQPGYDLHEGPKGKNRWMREVGEAMPALIRSSTVQQAEQEALKLGVQSADYQQSLDIANDVNDIFEQHSKKGGVLPDHVKIDPAIFVSWGQQYQFDPDRMPAAFWVDYQAGETHFYLNPASSYWNNKAAQASREHRAGYWSTGHADHPLWHELGHAMHHDNSPVAYQAQMKLSAVEKPIAGKVSLYAQDDVREFVAETFAALVQGKSFASDVLTLYQLYGGVLP